MECTSEFFLWTNANLKFLAMGTWSQMQDGGRDVWPKCWIPHISGNHPTCEDRAEASAVEVDTREMQILKYWSASVRRYWPQIRIRIHRQMLYSICCQSASAMIYIPYLQYTLQPKQSILSHSCIITLLVVCCISMASIEFSAISCSEITRLCTQLRPVQKCPFLKGGSVSVHVHEFSCTVSVHWSQEFLRICVHIWRTLLWNLNPCEVQCCCLLHPLHLPWRHCDCPRSRLTAACSLRVNTVGGRGWVHWSKRAAIHAARQPLMTGF